jgi:hypothetical protein
MTIALHRWTRETLLARLRASEAIDAAADADPASAARGRLRLLGLGDRFEAGVLSEADAIAEFDALRRSLTHVPQA